MKKIWTLYIATVMLCIFIMNAYLISGHTKDEFNCRASFTVSSYGFITSVVATIRSKNGSGVIFYDGPIYKGNNKFSYISRQVKFKIDHTNLSILLKGTSVRKNDTDKVSQDDAVKVLPDFFVKDNSSIYFDINEDTHGYFFIKDNVPMFFCRKLE